MSEPSPQRELPKEGDVIAGKYRIDKVIGLGGMGCVVAAQHLLLNQRVAIKFVLPEGANSAGYTARFFREAQAAAAIKSEHVVRVLDMGTLDNEMPYMVMEYLDGIDLAALVDKSGPLPIEDAVNYMLQACEALAEAHAAGLTHRDIKSSNLFLTHRTDGSPLIKLLDFGIAKAQTVLDGQLTATGAVMGSPSYMSPEQVRDAKTVDARSDIWSLGVTLYECLAGQPPFIATTFSALCVAIVTDPPARLSELRKDTPAGLEQVIQRCLEKEAAKRYDDVGDLAQALLPYAGPRQEAAVERIVRIVKGLPLPERRSGQPSLPRISVAPKAAAEAASPFDATAASSSAVIGIPAPEKSPPASKRPMIIAAIAAAVLVFAALALVFNGKATVTLDTDPQGPESPASAHTNTQVRPSNSGTGTSLNAASAATVEATPEPPPPASASATPSASIAVLPLSPAGVPQPPAPPTPPSVSATAPPPPPPPPPASAPPPTPKPSAKPKGTVNVDPFGNQH